MPRAPKKCASPNCETRVQGKTFCKPHTPVNWSSQSTRSSTEHKAWRRIVLKRSKGTCEIKLTGCTHRATEADHIKPIAEGGAEYDPDNGQGACSPCHQKKTQQEAQRGRERSKKGASTPPP